MTDSTTEQRNEPSDSSVTEAVDSSVNGQGPNDVIAALAEAEQALRRKRWPLLVLGAVLGGAAMWGGLAYFGDEADEEALAVEEVTLTTAPVEQRDLLEEIEWSGTLGYGAIVNVSGTGGTVTSVAQVGATLDRGDVIATVDGQPVIVLFGDTPMWRDLAQGDEGHDVYQLEANLAVLGYDPDQTVDIDTVFTSNTEAMIERWQEDQGLEVTGEVVLGSVVIVEGPSSLASVADVGASAGGTLATLAPRRAVSDVVAEIDGVISAVLAVGQPLEHASVLYQVDGIDVVALTELDPVSTVLTSDTFTVEELEQALADNGHDPDAEMTINATVTDATRAAVERWQSAAGLPVGGQTEPGYYTVVAEGRTVEAHFVEQDEAVIDGGPILMASVSRLAVDLVVDVAEADEFEIGQEVTIELADESTVAGVVSDISSVIQSDEPQGSPTVEITIDVVLALDGSDSGNEASTADVDLIEGPVTVISIGEAIEGATVVPTRALVTLAEGGFAVERVNGDGSSTLIGIEIGSFDEGVVEVVEGELSPGDEVVVPQ